MKKENVLDTDIIMVSDLDEIPSIEAILEYKDFHVCLGSFDMKFYNYYLNLLVESEPIWSKAKIFEYSEFDKVVPELSDTGIYETCLPPKCNKTNTATRIRLHGFGQVLKNGDWHFSWLGGAEKIKQKLESFAHQEWNTEELTDIKHIEECLKGYKSVIDLECTYKKVEIDDTFPKYIRDNLDKFKDYIL